jgi:hypothetical protein
MSKEKDLDRATKNWQKSLELIREALRNNENTGWYAKIEEEVDEDNN